MPARRSLRIACFVLCVVWLSMLTNCSLLSSEDASPNTNEEISSAAAQKAIDDARKLIVSEDDLNNAKGEAEQARATANKLKDKADNMRAATLSAGKDPDDPKAAPNTYSAIQEYQKADGEALQKQQAYEKLRDQNGKARQDLEKANAALSAAKQRESVAPGTRGGTGPDTERSGKTDSTLPSWPALFAAVGGFIVLGLLFWLTWRAINDAKKTTERLIRGIEQNQESRSTTTSSGLREIKAQLTQVQSDLAQVGKLVQTERQERLADRRQAAMSGAPITPSYHESSVDQQEDIWQFPTSASILLTHLGGQSPIIKPDPLKGILVKDPEGRGQLVLMQNHRMPDNQFYIVPRITRFQTKEDFYNHYEQFYDCNRPAAGEVWLHQPAAVDKVDGGWRLRDKGLLEIR